QHIPPPSKPSGTYIAEQHSADQQSVTMPFNVRSLNWRSSWRDDPPLAPGGPRQLVLANLAVLGVAACFALVYRFATALFILFVGIALGMTVKPGVEWLRRRGVARWVGALAIYVALAVAAAGVLLLVVPVLVEQLGSLL